MPKPIMATRRPFSCFRPIKATSRPIHSRMPQVTKLNRPLRPSIRERTTFVWLSTVSSTTSDTTARPMMTMPMTSGRALGWGAAFFGAALLLFAPERDDLDEIGRAHV